MRPRPYRLAAVAAVAAVAAALALAGCGATSADRFQGPERDVAQAVEDLQSAGVARNGEKICSEVLSRDLVRQIEEGGPCADEVEQAIAEAGDFELLVTDVTVEGDSATARVEAGADGGRPATFELVRQGEDGEERTATFELAREGREWRLSSFGSSS